MRMHWLRGGVVLVAVLALVGCGKTPPPEVVVDNTHLPDSIDTNIAQWLDQPRAELANLSEDRTEAVKQGLVDTRTANNALAELLPNLKPSLAPPVFRDVKYSKKAGVSLPTYLAEGTPDREVAWHLARFGDVEGAKKLVDPADKAFLSELEKLGYERNYPVEWTRLVALHLFSAELKLSNGEVEGASELVNLHRQLDKLLDDKAKAGPLGAALLPVGHRALTLSAPRFREAPFNKTVLADDIEAALKDWPEGPAPQPALAVGADKKTVARFFQQGQQGRVFAATGADAVRTLDLLALPVPSEDVNGVVAFLDRDELLAELVVYYHSNMRQNYPQPVNLAHHLVEGGSTNTELAELPGVLRQTYLAAGQTYEISVLLSVPSGSATASALIRVADAKGTRAEASLPANARDFVAVHLDHSFSQNRLSLDAAMKPGAELETSRPSAVDRVRQPIRDPKPSSVVLKKDADADLLESVAIRWSADVNKDAVAKLLVPLFAAYGGCRIDGVEDANGGHLAFVWENDSTRYTFELPYVDSNEPELVAADRRGADAVAKRKEAVAKFDQTDRKARLEAGTPQRRLDRWLFERDLTLGMSKADALQKLPKSQRIRQNEVADGMSLFYLAQPNAPEPYTAEPRQLWVRFGPDDRVAEIRVRYVEAKPEKTKPTLFDWLRREQQGEPEALVSRWTGLWPDLVKKGTPALYRWHDDVTVMTYERDAAGSEVTIRDCPLDKPQGVTLPPLQYCSRGIDHCHLGDSRADVVKHWPTDLPKTPDGGLVLGQPANSPYDRAIVWFENDKVVRVVAQHRLKAPLTYEGVPKALLEAWSRDIDTLGVVRRQDVPVAQLLQGYGWHDDVTRVRIFGQDSEDGPRLLTEWREWPVVLKTVATK